MKTEKSIIIAFILNLSFSVFEFFGGIFSGSVAIISDAVHDVGDAVSIGVAAFLEKKSKKQPDRTYTYGYAGYSVIGSAFTTLILLFGSVAVIYNAVLRLITPSEINYTGMILFAVAGVGVNLGAAILTHGGDSLNQKAVNLHMLEDVLGWIVVLVGAVIMRFTDIAIIDPLMSIGVATFIFINAIRNLKEAVDLFLEKTPHGIEIEEICEHLTHIEGVKDIHHVHVWSMDGHNNYATLHAVVDGDAHEIKEAIREELAEHGIAHATLELESPDEHCHELTCNPTTHEGGHGHHHHHHHGHHHH